VWRLAIFIPVDLNAFLCKNAEIMENPFLQMDKPEKAVEYRKIRDELKGGYQVTYSIKY
jgi:hypothetical protein